MKVVWSLFDGSGIMGLPWAEAGYHVYCFNADDADHGEYVVKMQHPNLHYINCWIDEEFGLKVQEFPEPNLIFAFPSCSDVAVCGSKHDKSDEAMNITVEQAKQIESLGKAFRCPWLVENPVSRLSTLWRKPNAYFHPWEYGGHMTADDRPYHPRMPMFDGYTKKTCLWFGNGFKMPEKCPGPINIGFFWGWKYLGGKSETTKQLRSLTPRGFARAVFRANHHDPS